MNATELAHEMPSLVKEYVDGGGSLRVLSTDHAAWSYRTGRALVVMTVQGGENTWVEC
jgi:hypothetical protein